MSGVEAAGLVLGTVPLAIRALEQYWSILNVNVYDYGYIRGLALETVFFQARAVVERIRNHVLTYSEDGAKEAWAVRESYTTSFNMIAVAGAIVAQIAITALSLDYLEATHWTATAAFVVSLIAGLLSVYYACILQQQPSGLHGPNEVKRWLTAVRDTKSSQLDPETETGQSKKHEEYIIPSYNAALLMVLPYISLNWASIALFIGIGIYYGIVHTKHLSSVQDGNSSLAILLVYVLFTLGATASYILPWLHKQLESAATGQSPLEQLFKPEAHGPPNAISEAEEFSHPAHINHAANRVRFDLLRTGGIERPDHAVPRQDQFMRSWDSAEVPSVSQTHASFPPCHRRSRPASNNPHVQFQARPSLSESTSCATAATATFIAALDASISAQKASLQAHELLRSELQKQEELRTSARRASL